MVRKKGSLRQTLFVWARALKTALARRGPAVESPEEPVETKPAAIPERPPESVVKKPRQPKIPPVSKPALPEPVTPKCPHCKQPMVLKTARTGRNAGEFWGCVAYPKCRGIRPIFRSPSAP